MKIEIRSEPYDPWLEISLYQESGGLTPGSFGACSAFVGTMRDFNDGSAVSVMELEHYEGMTEQQLSNLAQEAQASYGLLDVLILHRVGKISPNDPIVLVVAWSAHRAAAFDACRDMMELLKSKATFWKKETRPDGHRWVSQNTSG
ncbi:MAG: molybdenum cofactor biosynthesis protein MoaE [Gammaproteobacteria bacterium]|nr:molybdenum cofactor biosynthesis protein MoaE [Gammaproteobacteria bacterium]